MVPSERLPRHRFAADAQEGARLRCGGRHSSARVARRRRSFLHVTSANGTRLLAGDSLTRGMPAPRPAMSAPESRGHTQITHGYYILTRRRGVPTRHTHKWDGLHTRHLLESTHTNTHKHKQAHNAARQSNSPRRAGRCFPGHILQTIGRMSHTSGVAVTG